MGAMNTTPEGKDTEFVSTLKKYGTQLKTDAGIAGTSLADTWVKRASASLAAKQAQMAPMSATGGFDRCGCGSISGGRSSQYSSGMRTALMVISVIFLIVVASIIFKLEIMPAASARKTSYVLGALLVLGWFGALIDLY